ncbi:MAG: CPBP family intramembrane glutamic endopeptidase [Acidobacteriota bacterium]
MVIYFLAIHTLSQLAIAFLVQAFAGTEALTRMAEAQLPSPADRLFLLWLQAAVVPLALAATLLYLRRLDRRPASEVGLVWPAGAGGQAAAAAGLAAGGLITWRLLASPWLGIQRTPWPAEELEQIPGWLPLGGGDFLVLGLAFYAVAFFDEMVFRGYVYSTLRDRMGWVNSAGLAALLQVAAYSIMDLRAEALINAFLVALTLAGLRELSGSVWMGTLFTGTWNLILGSLLSLPVSGLFFPRFRSVEATGPDWVTGAEHGPEGGWLMTAVLLALVLGLAALVERKVQDEGTSGGPGSNAS